MSDQKIIYGTKRLIDLVWTLAFRVVDEEKKEIEIISYDRENPIGYEQEKKLPRIELIEEGGRNRIVVGVYLKAYEPFCYWASEKDHDIQYKVVNPKFVFDYKSEKV